MGTPHAYKPAGLIVCLLAGESVDLSPLRRRLTDDYGNIALESPDYPFTFTTYYEDEMGKNLVRRFWVFDRLIDPADLGKIKLRTNALEIEYAKELGWGDKRPVNLDPGGITTGKLMLASAKDFAGRVPVGDGLYVEITMFYKHDQWQKLPWTFPDFASGVYDEFLSQVRKWVGEKIRAVEK
jgi:hypothetical protein